MNDRLPAPKSGSTFAEEIGAKAARKLKARSEPGRDIWLGLGFMGLIGWSVVIPTLAGAALGIWIDKHHPGAHSWTLALLVAGLSLGCLNAWHWVSSQQKAMHDEEENQHE